MARAAAPETAQAPNRRPRRPQVVGAASVAFIVATRLQNFGVAGTSVTAGCLLSADATSNAPCVYAYTVAGVSAAASLAMSLLLCCTCDLCGCGAVLVFAQCVLVLALILAFAAC